MTCLNHYLASAGIASRRKAVDLIKQRRITVNGTIVATPAYRVQSGDQVWFDNTEIKISSEKLYILLNKPRGYVTTSKDEHNRKIVLDLVGPRLKKRVVPVGRLDRDTTGLLLLTNDGDFANRVTHPRFKMQKNYMVMLDRPLLKEDREKLLSGVWLPDGRALFDHCHVKSGRIVSVVLHSGKNRIIRRMFQAIGYHVLALDRIKIADLAKKGLPVGAWRFLTRDEVGAFHIERNKL